MKYDMCTNVSEKHSASIFRVAVKRVAEGFYAVYTDIYRNFERSVVPLSSGNPAVRI
jgi:hypothetical protein